MLRKNYYELYNSLYKTGCLSNLYILKIKWRSSVINPQPSKAAHSKHTRGATVFDDQRFGAARQASLTVSHTRHLFQKKKIENRENVYISQ